MTINKKILSLHFSNSARDYDKLAQMQKEIAFQLFDWCCGKNKQTDRGERVLEIGCGTGFLTEFLLKSLQPLSFTAIDIANGMLQTARIKFNRSSILLNLIQADGENLPFLSGSFDLVASSTAFQWFSLLEQSLEGIHRVLRPGGRLVFATLGRDTFRELKESYRTCAGQMGIKLTSSRYGLSLPGTYELADIIERAGFEKPEIDNVIKLEFFPSARDFMHSLKLRGASNPNYRPMNLSVERELMKKTIAFYDKRFRMDGRVYASYEVFFVRTQRK